MALTRWLREVLGYEFDGLRLRRVVRRDDDRLAYEVLSQKDGYVEIFISDRIDMWRHYTISVDVPHVEHVLQGKLIGRWDRDRIDGPIYLKR